MDESGLSNNSHEPAISFEYYNESSKYSYHTTHKPTLYDILYFVKRTFHVFVSEQLQMDEWMSIDQLKREYPENKETYETSEKLRSIFSEIEMLKIPITLGCPFYDDYWEELFQLDEIENANSESEGI